MPSRDIISDAKRNKRGDELVERRLARKANFNRLGQERDYLNTLLVDVKAENYSAEDITKITAEIQDFKKQAQTFVDSVTI